MEQRVYQGQIDPHGLAEALLDEWDRDDTIAQAFDADTQVIVQVGQREGGWFSDEPHQAITLSIEPTGDGVRVTMGQQQWYKQNDVQIITGGLVGFFPFFFTFPLGNIFGGGEDEIDRSLPGQIWQSVERYTARFGGATTGRTQRLPTVACHACGVANPLHAERCSACGADLSVSPNTCPNCSHVNPNGANFCNRCGTQLVAAA
jgi:ribosomal protein L40E